MKVVMPDKPVFVDDTKGNAYCYKPNTRYIVSDWETLMLTNISRQTQWHTSSFNPYEKRYGGQDLSGKKVCLYRHAAFGDQLMISAVPRYLKTLYPDAIIHMYCDPSFRHMWDGNPFVEGTAIPIPIPFDAARGYDYHIFYEGMLENNGEPDQENCYDDFFSMVGLRDVPARFKRPYIVVRPEDYKELLGVNHDEPYIVYHLSPANKNRCYPPKYGMEFLRRFILAKPEYRVYVVGEDIYPDIVNRMCDRTHHRVVNLCGRTKNFRHLIPLIERAKLVVCPDSSVMHLAAAFDNVPVISLWGLFHPNDRVKYYPNHFPIVCPDACPHSPCHNHDFQLPMDKCKDAKNHDPDRPSEFCYALMAIEPDYILQVALKIL